MTLPNGTVTQGLNELNRRACISRVSVHMKTADLKKLQILSVCFSRILTSRLFVTFCPGFDNEIMFCLFFNELALFL